MSVRSGHEIARFFRLDVKLIVFKFLALYSLTIVVISRAHRSKHQIYAAVPRHDFHMNERVQVRQCRIWKCYNSLFRRQMARFPPIRPWPKLRLWFYSFTLG